MVRFQENQKQEKLSRTFGEAIQSRACLCFLADLLNASQADVHWIHFHAAGSDFDNIHEVANDYYDYLGFDYDSIIELCLQIKVPFNHPNDSAMKIGFVNETALSYDRKKAYTRIKALLENILIYASEALKQHQSSSENDTAIKSFLECLIQYWSKEARYKSLRRLMDV